MEKGGITMLWFFLLLVPIGLLVLLIIFKGFFYVSQAQAGVIERLGKFNRVVYSGLHLRWPFLESFRLVGFINREEYRKDFGPYRIDLREQIFDLCKQHVITKDNVALDVDTIIYYRVTEPEKTVYGITDLPKAIEQLALTNIRNEFGRMDLDISLGSRTQMNDNIKATLDEATKEWGVNILRVEVQEIIPPTDLKDTMDKQMMAERERRVKVLGAQAEKEAMVLMAEGAKQKAILEAEAQKELEILKAQAEKEKIVLEAEAAREKFILTSEGKKLALTMESEGEKAARINLAEAEAERILKELRSERDRLTTAIEALEGGHISRAAGPTTRRVATRRKRRLTPEGRRRLSEMMKKRWAERRKKASRAA